MCGWMFTSQRREAG